jgi:hypothetical protein
MLEGYKFNGQIKRTTIDTAYEDREENVFINYIKENIHPTLFINVNVNSRLEAIDHKKPFGYFSISEGKGWIIKYKDNSMFYENKFSMAFGSGGCVDIFDVVEKTCPFEGFKKLIRVFKDYTTLVY